MSNGVLTKLSGYALKVLHATSNDEIPPLAVILDTADQLGAVTVGRASSWDPGPWECEIRLRNDLSGNNMLWFRGYGQTRGQATADAIGEAMLYVQAKHGRHL